MLHSEAEASAGPKSLRSMPSNWKVHTVGLRGCNQTASQCHKECGNSKKKSTSALEVETAVVNFENARRHLLCKKLRSDCIGGKNFTSLDKCGMCDRHCRSANKRNTPCQLALAGEVETLSPFPSTLLPAAWNHTTSQ